LREPAEPSRARFIGLIPAVVIEDIRGRTALRAHADDSARSAADVAPAGRGRRRHREAMVSDTCDASVMVGNDAPAFFPVGETIVTWTATDESGNGHRRYRR
jgi:hypothetical protein